MYMYVYQCYIYIHTSGCSIHIPVRVSAYVVINPGSSRLQDPPITNRRFLRSPGFRVSGFKVCFTYV